MNKLSVIMFPGQGVQYQGMGGELFAEFPKYIDLANSILGFDIQALCELDTRQQLNQTQYTQPALFLVNALYYLRHLANNSLSENTIFLGHSLGEFNALFAAKAFSFETGLRLVKKRGELMSSVKNGSMAAIIGLPVEAIEEILKNQYPDIDIANINSLSQIVISGPEVSLSQAADALEEAGAAFIPLKVSGAFHSRYMSSCKQEFQAYLQNFSYSNLQFPVIANCSAEPYKNQRLIETMAEQMTATVRWLDSVIRLLTLNNAEFIELGPGSVLTDLVKKILKQRSMESLIYGRNNQTA